MIAKLFEVLNDNGQSIEIELGPSKEDPINISINNEVNIEIKYNQDIINLFKEAVRIYENIKIEEGK